MNTGKRIEIPGIDLIPAQIPPATLEFRESVHHVGR